MFLKFILDAYYDNWVTWWKVIGLIPDMLQLIKTRFYISDKNGNLRARKL